MSERSGIEYHNEWTSKEVNSLMMLDLMIRVRC